MVQHLIRAALAGMVMSLSVFSAFAQTDVKCRGPIYSGNEVSQRAKITESADLENVYKALGKDIQGHGRARCRCSTGGR